VNAKPERPDDMPYAFDPELAAAAALLA